MIADETQMAKESIKEKTPSAAKQAQVEASANNKPPSVTKSKASKAAAAPAENWDQPAATGDWNNSGPQDWTNPVDPKPASRTPSKVAPKASSKTASQKEKQAPGAYPVSSASSHHTASNAAAAAASSHHTASNAGKSAAKSGSKKSNKEDAAAAAGAEQPTTGGENWDQPQDDAAWDTTPATGGWNGGAAPAADFNNW